jgi:hypothetical protein
MIDMSKRGFSRYFRRYANYVCVFLIYLIIMPTLHTANVFAEFYGNVHGSDEVISFRKSTGDITIINVSAKPDEAGEEIEENQIKLLSEPTRRFECSEKNEAGFKNCEMRLPGDLEGGQYIYEVQLFKRDMSEAEPKIPLIIYVDSKAPLVHSFRLVRNESRIEAEYVVSDSLCESCPPESCSGIKKTEFLLNHVKVGEEEINITSCFWENKTTLEIEKTSGTSTKTLCIEVQDKLGQKTTKCEKIIMDFSPPKIINASLKTGNEIITYTRGEPIGNVVVELYFEEETELNISSVRADLSKLNSRAEFSSAYRQLAPTGCEKTGEKEYRCVWENILVIISSGEAELRIKSSDILGNNKEESVLIPTLFDNTKPVVTAIRTGIPDDKGRYWAGKNNNTIYLDIHEEGSGLREGKILLDLNSFGPQPRAHERTILLPNNCTEGWICVWDYIQVIGERKSGDILGVNVKAGSEDDAGNPAEGMTTAGIYYDNEPPEIVEVKQPGICPTAPESLDITITASEKYSGGVKATIFASEISTSTFPQTTDCEETEIRGTWQCKITIENIVTIATKEKINITLEDRAGNKETTQLEQEICEAAPGTPPNVIRVTKCEVLPITGIDRKAASEIPFPIFLRPTLTPINPSTGVQEVRAITCNATNSTFSEPYIIDESNLKNPLIATKIQLTKTSETEGDEKSDEEIEIECQINMIVRAGNRVYQEPETDIVRCEKVPVHGTVFGGMDKSLKATLDDIENQIAKKESEISDYEGWLDVLGTFCTLAELAAKLSAAMQILREVIWLVALVLYHITSTQSRGRQLYYYTCLISEWVSAITMTLLWNIDSAISFGGQSAEDYLDTMTSTGFYFKILCGMFSCRLTDQNTIVELLGGAFTEWGSYNSQSYSKFVEETEVEGGKNEFPVGEGGEGAGGGAKIQRIPSDVYEVIFSAYRCKEMTNAFLCMPGYVYALKKERQLLCMKKNCYKEYAAAGFSPQICDKMYEGRRCLYVTSAAYKIAGDEAAGRITAGVFEYILSQAIGSVGANTLRKLTGTRSNNACAYPYGILKGFAENKIKDGVENECGTSAQTSSPDWMDTGDSHICGLILASFIWLDVGDWLSSDDFDWNYYNKKLGEPDYCKMEEE